MRRSRRQIAILLAAGIPLLALSGLSAQTSSAVQPQPALPQFEDVTAKSGIHFQHSFGEKELRTILEGTGI